MPRFYVVETQPIRFQIFVCPVFLVQQRCSHIVRWCNGSKHFFPF